VLSLPPGLRAFPAGGEVRFAAAFFARDPGKRVMFSPE